MNLRQELDNARAYIWSMFSRGSGAGGGFSHFRYAAIAGAAVTIIPDDENDVTRGLRIMWAGYTSGATFFSGCDQCVNGATLNLFNVAADTLQLAVSAGGAATVSRTAGALTYDLSVWLVWL